MNLIALKTPEQDGEAKDENDLQDLQEEAQGLTTIINAKAPEEESEAKSMTTISNARKE